MRRSPRGANAARRKPVKEPPLLFDSTQKIINEVEKRLEEGFLAYWNSPNGSVCHNDVLGFYELLRHLGSRERLFLYIKSDGGTGQASLRIVHLLRQHARWLGALVPLECASAATMLALGADEIRMGPLAYLTAIDTSIRHDLSPLDVDNNRVSVGLDELGRVVNLWRHEADGGGTNPYQAVFQYVNPLVIGAADRASSLSIRLCTEILSYHMADRKRAEEISRNLNSNYPTHSYPITITEAARVGLNAQPLDAAVNDLLLELNELYSEMGQRARTDFDEENHHDNEILNIIEGRNLQLFYQNDQDWHYRKEERRWVSLNDESSWRKVERVAGRVRRSVFHIR
jgi:hypothetical protein